MKKKILTGIFMLFFCISFSQLINKFEPVSITLTNGKVMNGFLMIPTLNNEVKPLKFKENSESTTVTTFPIQDVQSFRTPENEYYLFINVKINNKPSLLLTKQLIDGQASLYQSYINNKKCYVITNKEKTVLLQEDELLVGESKITKHNYFGKLNYVLEGFVSKDDYIASFNKKYFTKTITNYNVKNNSKSKLVDSKKRNKDYLIATIAGNFFNDNKSEYLLQLNYRRYLTDYSDKTSINIGLTYNRYDITETVQSTFTAPYELKSWANFYNIPLYIQHDLIRAKKLRLGLIAGMQLSYIDIGGDAANNRQQGQFFGSDDKFQKDYGISFLYGASLEFDINKHFMLSAIYRNSIYEHLPMLGISYYFERK